jgi:hypothetical protein
MKGNYTVSDDMKVTDAEAAEFVPAATRPRAEIIKRAEKAIQKYRDYFTPDEPIHHNKRK